MTHQELVSIAEKWIKAWNEYDHATLNGMMKADSCFAQMGAILNPIVAHGQPLISENYASEWFYRMTKVYKQSGITFDVKGVKTGDGFMQIKSVSSLGHYVVDFLRIDANGKIDQHNRTSDIFHWVGEIV